MFDSYDANIDFTSKDTNLVIESISIKNDEIEKIFY